MIDEDYKRPNENYGFIHKTKPITLRRKRQRAFDKFYKELCALQLPNALAIRKHKAKPTSLREKWRLHVRKGLKKGTIIMDEAHD